MTTNFRRFRSTFLVLRSSKWFLVVWFHKCKIEIVNNSNHWNNGDEGWRFFAIIGLKETEELKMADPVSKYDAKLLKNLGGVGLVMTIIFTISVRTTSIVDTCIFLIFHITDFPSLKQIKMSKNQVLNKLADWSPHCRNREAANTKNVTAVQKRTTLSCRQWCTKGKLHRGRVHMKRFL